MYIHVCICKLIIDEANNNAMLAQSVIALVRTELTDWQDLCEQLLPKVWILPGSS